MTELTVIVKTLGTDILSIRTCAGHMSKESMDAYVSGLEQDAGGTKVVFQPIDLYEDLGDPSDNKIVYQLRLAGWTRVDE